MSYWQNYPKFHVSLMKAWYGNAATKENNWAYDYLPKLDKGYDVLQAFELMGQGKINGYICQGFNPVALVSEQGKDDAGLVKAQVPGHHRSAGDRDRRSSGRISAPYNDVDPTKIQTEVFRLPSTCFAEEDGSLTNSGRWLQWHWKGAEPPGEAKGDQEIIAGIFLRMRAMYAKDGGAYPDPYSISPGLTRSRRPLADELAMEYNGKALADLTDPKDPTKVLVPAAAARRLRLAARRRLHCLRLLDLLRRMDAGGQPDGAARQQRSVGHRADARLGLGVAGQSAHPLQPRVVRSVGQAVECEAQA